MNRVGAKAAGAVGRVGYSRARSPQVASRAFAAGERKTDLSCLTVYPAMELLIAQVIAWKTSGKHRGRMFASDQSPSVLGEGTETEAEG